ncbi:MAG: Ig-like domain-containing protein, partial [Bacteroidetes bacterium]|nr:Ig-like domain-containing protein [Bacteroidota bacterium]
MVKKFLFSIVFVSLAILLACCAGQVPPGGGPPDTTPPTVMFTDPDTNSVNVQTNRIVLEFSEYVDRRSVEESIFISPYLGQLEFDWSGREVEISFTEQLKRNTTYVVNLGTDIVDIRARNRMEGGFTLAFSTGETIDQGMIQGRVFDDKPEGIMMFAYALGDIDPDTLDPSTTKPDYIMQTGTNGRFTFSNIRFDAYRVFAVRDEYRNLIYDKQIDQFGVTTGDVTLNDTNPRASDLWFRLSAEDTAKPFLTRVVPQTQTLLQVRFSEPLDTASFTRSTMILQDTLTLQPVDILLRSLDRSDSTTALVITSVPLDSGRAYRLSVRNVKDRVGNEIDTVNASFDFLGVSTPDTLAPHLQVVGLR